MVVHPHAKHLRKKKGKRTKSMANGKKLQSKSKLEIMKSCAEDKKGAKWLHFKNAPKESACPINNEFDEAHWNWQINFPQKETLQTKKSKTWSEEHTLEIVKNLVQNPV